MTDTFSVPLDEAGDWFLGADSSQWIIQRKRTAKGVEMLIGQSFIGSEKRILHRCIKRHNITLTDEAKATIDSFPERFLDFVDIYHTKSGKGRRKKEG